MSEIDQLKFEARQLLEEVNNEFERNSGRQSTRRFYDYGSTLENSFKHKLKELRQRAVSLKSVTASFAHR